MPAARTPHFRADLLPARCAFRGGAVQRPETRPARRAACSPARLRACSRYTAPAWLGMPSTAERRSCCNNARVRVRVLATARPTARIARPIAAPFRRLAASSDSPYKPRARACSGRSHTRVQQARTEHAPHARMISQPAPPLPAPCSSGDQRELPSGRASVGACSWATEQPSTSQAHVGRAKHGCAARRRGRGAAGRRGATAGPDGRAKRVAVLHAVQQGGCSAGDDDDSRFYLVVRAFRRQRR